MSDRLARTLGLWDLVLLACGTVIGSGVFLVPAVVLRHVNGALGPAVLVWLVAGVLSMLGALTYAELGAARPESGGLYGYIRDAFGPLPAFLYGWTTFTMIAAGSSATLAVAFANYLGTFVTLGPWGTRAVAAGLLAGLAAVNVRGTRQATGAQNAGTLLKLAAIVAMSVALLVVGRGGGTAVPTWPTAITPSLLSGLGLAMIGVLWAYEGWQYATFAAGEVRDPQRTFPRGLAIATLLLIVLYLGANAGFVAALGVPGVMASTRVAADAMTVSFGPVAGQLVSAVILVSIASAANGIAFTAPRLYFAMARDGLFFARLGEVHPRFGTPALAIVASSAWAMVLAVSGTFETLLTYVVFTGWIFYGVGAACVFVFRRREAAATRPYLVPGYPVTPLLFIASAAGIVGNALVSAPAQALVGLAAVLSGVPAYAWWRRQGTPGSVSSRRTAR